MNQNFISHRQFLTCASLPPSLASTQVKLKMQDTLINHKRDVLVQHKVQSSAIQSDLDELAKRKVCDTILAFFQVLPNLSKECVKFVKRVN